MDLQAGYDDHGKSGISGSIWSSVEAMVYQDDEKHQLI